MAAKNLGGKTKTVFRCTDCGAPAPKWNGRCGTCGAWNSLVEEFIGVAAPVSALAPSSPARPIADIDAASGFAVPTGIAEFDRLLGGGLVPGSVTLIGGEPGIGKSTLLLQILGAVAASGRRALLVSGEESAAQVRSRAVRLGALHPTLLMAAETALPLVLGHLEHERPDVVVIDSIQTMHDPELASSPGSVGQVRECSHALVRIAKERGLTVLIVGHVTKEGSLAGPRVLEHIVDTVLEFEGDRHHALRVLRAVKHRFGGTGELGLFEMLEEGLVAVADPSALFLADRNAASPGSIITATMEGARPLLVETQALVTSTSLSFPRRAATGLDGNRLAVLLAVLEERAKIGITQCDVFATVVGGVRVTEPGIDLAVSMALASAYAEEVIPDDVIALGEVGLGGEIRTVTHLGKRLAEAARLGFKTAVVPISAPEIAGVNIVRCRSIREALDEFGLRRASGKGFRPRPGAETAKGPASPRQARTTAAASRYDVGLDASERFASARDADFDDAF